MRSFTWLMLFVLLVMCAADHGRAQVFRAFRVSGPSIVWRTLQRDEMNRSKLGVQLFYDVEDHLINKGCQRNTNNYYETFVNSSGFFIGLWVIGCNYEIVAKQVEGLPLDRTSHFLRSSLQDIYSNMSQYVLTTDVFIESYYLLSGEVPVPPPGVISSTTNKQTILLSCNESTWMSVLKNTDSIREAIEHDVAATLSHSGVIARCAVFSMLWRAADATRMLPGDGTPGLTVDVTITQDIIEGHPNNPYNTHAMSSALMSMPLTETNEVYAKSIHYTSNDTIRVVAVYENMVYSSLDCEYLCIIALVIFISVVYLMLTIFIITLVATKYYLVQDFQWLEDDLKYWTGRNIIL